MINPTYVGKRIREERKKRGLTQEQLSELFNVSPQAVSKWESGRSIPDMDTILALSNYFHVTINQLLESKNLLDRISIRPYQTNDIVLYIEDHEKPENYDWISMIQNDHLMETIWERQQKEIITDPWFKDIVKTILEKESPILELGVGPGGGFVPSLLHAKPSAEIILCDLSPFFIRSWKEILSRYPQYSNVYYTVFDFCDIPFDENSIGAISDYGGLANCEGDKMKAIQECYRVLKPGGLMVTTGSFISSEGSYELNDSEKETLFRNHPTARDSMNDRFYEAGFSDVRTKLNGKFVPQKEDSEMGSLIGTFASKPTFINFTRYCIK